MFLTSNENLSSFSNINQFADFCNSHPKFLELRRTIPNFEVFIQTYIFNSQNDSDLLCMFEDFFTNTIKVLDNYGRQLFNMSKTHSHNIALVETNYKLIRLVRLVCKTLNILKAFSASSQMRKVDYCLVYVIATLLSNYFYLSINHLTTIDHLFGELLSELFIRVNNTDVNSIAKKITVLF